MAPRPPRRSSRTTRRRASAALRAKRPRGRPRATSAPAAGRGGWRRLRASPKRLLPALAETHRRDDQADHRVGLREIAPQLAGLGVDVLGQQAEMAAALEELF